MGLAPRLGEALGVDKRDVEFEACGRRLRGRMVVEVFAEDSGTRPDEEEVRFIEGGSGIVM